MLRERFFPHWIFRLQPGNRRVLLTFDDGPHPDSTPRLLEALERTHMKCLMFLVGAHCRKYPALVREIQTCGHQIGVHGDTHRSHLLYTPAQVRNSARNSIHAIADAGASSLQLFRPPYGHLNPLTQRALAQVGMRGMLWSLILNDWRPQPLQPMLSKVRMSIEDGTILVLHDSPCATNNILPLLPELAPLATAAALNFTQITPADLAQ